MSFHDEASAEIGESWFVNTDEIARSPGMIKSGNDSVGSFPAWILGHDPHFCEMRSCPGFLIRSKTGQEWRSGGFAFFASLRDIFILCDAVALCLSALAPRRAVSSGAWCTCTSCASHHGALYPQAPDALAPPVLRVRFLQAAKIL
jgi:hypothetical protein